MSTKATNTNDSSGSDGEASGVTGKTREAASAASRRAADAYSAARERTSSAYGSARETASRAGERASQRIDSNPVAAIVGGIAIGGVIAWLLPKTQRETEALGAVGSKITDTARQAAQTAMDAGREQVNEIKETAASNIGHAVMAAVSPSSSDQQ
jgi:ElaB/YqjD/DUF883 family membrane-anchored ribosome-binding protein